MWKLKKKKKPYSRKNLFHSGILFIVSYNKMGAEEILYLNISQSLSVKDVIRDADCI